MRKNKNNKRVAVNQNGQNRNTMNTTLSIDSVPEYIQHATVAMLTENEKEEYSKEKVLKSKVVCKKCGIEFYSSIATKCPVCEINEKIRDLQKVTLSILEASGCVIHEKNAALQLGQGTLTANTGAIEFATTHTHNEKRTTGVLHNYKYGDVINFGKYDGVPIKWQVIQVKDNELLVLAKEGIEARAYHSKSGSVTWETSTIRQYLNNEFLNKCFDIEEQKIIRPTGVKNRGNVLTGVSGGKDTNDLLFLLSIDETEVMFNSNADRRCHVTEQAKNNGAYVDMNTDTGWWWLRSPGEKDIYASYVAADGSVVKGGCYTGSSRGILRPAMWVDRNAL